MQDIIAELNWRGLIHQTTEQLPQMTAWLSEKSRTVYAGFDPTADSLHVGHLIPLLMLRRFQRAEDELGDTGRILLRPSGTEQVIRVMVEAEDEHTARRLAALVAETVRAQH